ncbi:MAG: alpha/beta hydrolase [Deltaproteobacteria bacterium]|nr:alpha/beta hydrolase [Deltaproteobacteria bacterium]MBT7716629.1 alpha/beta hydrolase [Deltaproteobacteria bacterium]
MSNSTILDCKLFSPESISRETSELNVEIQKTAAKTPPIYTVPPQKIRDNTEAGKGFWLVKRLDIVEDRSISGPAGNIPLRVFVPETVRGVYLHIHGGGFMLGRAYYSDMAMVQLANNCGMATVSVDYRLAPENPYPAGADDCETAAVWLVEKAKKEFGTELLLIGGESAGANLSVVTILRMRDKHRFTGFTGANLVYGVYDLTHTPSAKNWGEERKLILTTKVMNWFHQNYVSAKKMSDPDVSPLNADLSNMPPALFTVGTLDPLLDDTLFMHSRWIAAGNEAELAVYPGGCHAFNAFPIGIAHQANKKMGQFFSKQLE